MVCETLHLLVAQSAKSIIKAELQLLQSIIYPGRDKLCCHSPYCLLLHMLITPGVLNRSSFYIRVRESRIFGDEFISVTMLNGQCLQWCVHFSSMTQQFLATRWASVHNVVFWQKTKSVISTIVFLKCQSPAAVLFLSVRPACPGFVLFSYQHIAMLQAQYSQDRTRPSQSNPVASVHGSPLRKRDSQPFGMLRCWHPCRESRQTA